MHDDAPATARVAGRHAHRRRATQRHAGADRHADRARRHRRPGHAGLALSRRPRRPARRRRSRWRAAAAESSCRRSKCSASSRSDTRGLLGMADARRRARLRRTERRADARSALGAPEFRASGCARSSKRAVAARRYRAPCSDAMPVTCTSRSTSADGRALRNAARRAPGRRDLHPGALHRAVVLPVAARRLAAPVLEPGAERVVIFHLITEGECFVELDDERPGAPHRRRRRALSARRRASHDVRAGPAACARHAAWTESWRAARASFLRRRRRADAPRVRLSRLRCPPRADAARRAAVACVRVNVRGSNAGVWLEASVRYALAEARSPRPGGAGVLAKLVRGAVHRSAAPVHERAGRGPHRLARRRRRSHRRRRVERAAQAAGARLDARGAGARVAAPRDRCSPSASSTSSAARRCST